MLLSRHERKAYQEKHAYDMHMYIPCKWGTRKGKQGPFVAAQDKKKVTYDMLEDTPLSQSRCDDSSVNTHA
jgi:hypothetical protein